MIIWTPCIVYTINLALKNIFATKNVENNQVVYGECSWIFDVAGDVMAVKNVIMNHSIRLTMFNEFVPPKLRSSELVIQTHLVHIWCMTCGIR
ncbi:hypothetical protein IC582_026409 [Cucumis melo]